MSADPADVGAATLLQAARDLDISVSTLRRWLAQGAPQTRRGSPGRGCRTLVDVSAIRAWRARSSSSDDAAALRVFAAEIPELVSKAICDSYDRLDGWMLMHAAGPMAGTWYVVVCALLDRVRETVPDVPEVSAIPLEIERLRKIATGE